MKLYVSHQLLVLPSSTIARLLQATNKTKKRTHCSNDNRQSSNETLAIGNNDCSKAVALASTAEMNARHQDEMGREKNKTERRRKKYNKQ